jgi:K(+)-stimulated pyrophosphate-energized sodium pump
VRRQFRDIPALHAALEVMRKYDSDMSKASAEDRKIFDAADGVAEYEKCVEISTKASIREMVLPGLLAIAVPVLIGFIGGAEMLGGLLAGVTSAGVLMAIFQSNAGGAWDNAKKMIEEQGRKGTDAHKAAVVGDTVGDPFKDTSGPSLNILLKLMSVVALVIAPSIALDTEEVSAYNENKIETAPLVEVVEVQTSDASAKELSTEEIVVVEKVVTSEEAVATATADAEKSAEEKE